MNCLKRTGQFLSTLFFISISCHLLAAITEQPAPSVTLTKQESDWLALHPEIRISAEAGWPPFEYTDNNGELQGITADYLQLIGEMLGVRFSVETQRPWKEKLDWLRQRKLDAALSTSITRERQEFLSFTQPYFLSPVVIVSRKDEIIVTLDDPELKTIAIESGYFLESDLRKNHSHLDIVSFDQSNEALEAVSSGQAQIYIGGRAVASYLIDRDLITNLKIAARAPYPGSTFHIAVRNDWPLLKQLFQKALNQISVEQHQSIRRKWIPVEDSARFPGVPLNIEEKAWLQENPIIQVGGESDWPPYDFVDKNNQHSGVSADLIQILGNRLGVQFEVITDRPWVNLLNSVRSGEIKAAIAIVQTAERKKDIIFTSPYALTPVGIITRNDTHNIQSLADLANKRVAIPSSYAEIEQLRIRYPDFVHVEANSITAALKAVQNRQADAFIGSTEVAAYLIDQNKMTNLRFADRDVPLRSGALHIGISSEYPVLASILQKTLNTISSEEIDIILKRWVTDVTSSQVSSKRITLTPNEQAWLTSQAPIKFTADPNWLPFEAFNKEGEYIGIISEIVELISARTGIQFDFIPSHNWLDAVEMASKGEVDVISGDLSDVKLQKTHQFTQAYLEQPVAIAMRDKQQNLISDLYEIADQKIAIIEGYGYTANIVNHYPEIEFKRVSNIQEALLGLSTGSIDAFVGSFNLISYHINHLGLNNLRIVGQAPFNIRIGLAVPKDMPALLSLLNKSIATITAAEKFQITENWMQEKYITQVDNSPWFRALAAASLILLFFLILFLIWNRLLKGQVRKRTASLHHSRDSLANAQRIAHLGNWEWDFKTDAVSWSDEVYRIFGYQPGAIQPTGELFAQHLSSGDNSTVLKAIRSLLKSRETRDLTLSVNRVDGETRRVRVQAQPVRHQSSTTGLFGTFQDVTSQYNTEKALRESESKYRHFFESNTAGIMNIEHRPPIPINLPISEQIKLILKTSVVVEVNSVFSEILGYSEHKQYMGERFGRHIDQTDALNQKGIEAFISNDYRMQGELIHIQSNSGDDIYLLSNAIGLIKNGHLHSTWISSTDITPRLNAESALRDSEEKFSKAFSSSPDAIIFTSITDGRYLDVNESFLKLCGYSKKEVLGKTISEISFWKSESQYEDTLQKIHTDREVRDLKVIFRTKSGELRTGLMTGGLIDLKGEICLVSVIRDITEKIQLEKKTRDQELQLLQANKMTSLGTLVAGVAHEINNPNQLIIINAEILGKAWPDILSRLKNNDGDHPTIGGLPEAEMLETIPILLADMQDASIRINRIVNDLKDFSRPQGKNAENEFDINKTIQRGLGLLNHYIKEKTNHFAAHLSPDLPMMIGNQQHFEQIIINLVTNALENLPDKVKSVTISTELDPARKKIILSVKDEGSGIIPEHLPKLFDPFFTTRQSQGGTGLGLSITYNLVRQLGGEINVESTPEQGTSFTVLLPAQVTE